MRIRIVKDCEIEIVERMIGDDPVSSIEVFKEGEILEVDVFGFGNDDINFPQFQFADGSVTYAISRDWFEFTDDLYEQEYLDEFETLCGE
jgi:hypothetical protein